MAVTFTALCFIERELVPIEVLHCRNRNIRPFWLLRPWPRPDDLHIRNEPVSPGCVKMNVLHKGFRKLSYEGRWMRAFSYAWSLLVTWRRWRSHHSIRHSRKPRATGKTHGSICYTTGLVWTIEVYIFDVFGSCDLDLDPMTFIYELDLYCQDIYRICKYELPMSRLSKVIVWQTGRHTYIHTDIDRKKNTNR